jgi:hypothetical protein
LSGHLFTTTGITGEQLAEIGIATQLLRKSILKAFEALVKAKGLQ